MQHRDHPPAANPAGEAHHPIGWRHHPLPNGGGTVNPAMARLPRLLWIRKVKASHHPQRAHGWVPVVGAGWRPGRGGPTGLRTSEHGQACTADQDPQSYRRQGASGKGDDGHAATLALCERDRKNDRVICGSGGADACPVDKASHLNSSRLPREVSTPRVIHPQQSRFTRGENDERSPWRIVAGGA